MENKTILNLFQEKEIRSIWDSEKNDYYFSVVDVIEALTESTNPRNYWNMLKKRLIVEGSKLYTNCVQLKMKSRKDGKKYITDTLDTQGIFRLIESVPSPNAEPFKLWLAKLGRERVDEVFDPEIAINRAIDYYRRKGYDDEWIDKRLKGILNRKQLTDVWNQGGIKEDYEYAILTNVMYKGWSGMKANEYKDYKGLHKESLRDNMSEIEVVLTDLSEITTKNLAKKTKPKGLKENIEVAQKGSITSKKARETYESILNESAITSDNHINGRHINNNLIDKK